MLDWLWPQQTPSLGVKSDIKDIKSTQDISNKTQKLSVSDLEDIKGLPTDSEASHIPGLNYVSNTTDTFCTGAAPAGAPRYVYMETYGCQMNVNDTEIVLAVLAENNVHQTDDISEADVILVNTCAIREHAETKVWNRLKRFRVLKQAAVHAGRATPVVGVLGCMAERLKEVLLQADGLADIVAGPDSYRDVPRLIDVVQAQRLGGGVDTSAMNVQLSLEETYADITPLRQPGAVTAFVSIMRGCNNMCSFCIVPYTRGPERSRPAASIVREIAQLSAAGVRDVTLLGQNVNSYADFSECEDVSVASGGGARGGGSGTDDPNPYADYAKGFKSIYKPRRSGAIKFGELLRRVAAVDPEMRIRFTSPHPKDFSDEVLEAMLAHGNICKWVNMPAQSGSTTMLRRMNRGYTREAYLQLAQHIRDKLPGVSLCTDIIMGFCEETEQEAKDTLTLLDIVGYEQAFLFAYSDRGKTAASRKYKDNVPQSVKKQRLTDAVAIFRKRAHDRNQAEIGRRHLVLIEGRGKRAGQWAGRTDTNKRAILADVPLPDKRVLGKARTVPVVTHCDDSAREEARGGGGCDGEGTGGECCGEGGCGEGQGMGGAQAQGGFESSMPAVGGGRKDEGCGGSCECKGGGEEKAGVVEERVGLQNGNSSLGVVEQDGLRQGSSEASLEEGEEENEVLEEGMVRLQVGDYVAVQVVNATSQSLRCVGLYRSSVTDYMAEYGTCCPQTVYDQIGDGTI